MDHNPPKKAVHAIPYVHPRAIHLCTFHRRPESQLSISSPNSKRHRLGGLLQCYTSLVIPHNYAVHRAHLGYIYPLSPNATCRLRPTHSTPHQPTYQCTAAPQADLILHQPPSSRTPNLPQPPHWPIMYTFCPGRKMPDVIGLLCEEVKGVMRRLS